MSTDADLAESFYGNSMARPTGAAAAPAQSNGEQSTADAFFGKTTKPEAKASSPASVKEADIHSDEAMGRAMHGDSAIHGDAQRSIANAAREHALASPAQAAEIAESWMPMMQAYELNATESAQLSELGVSMTVNPVDAPTVEAWVGDAKSVLRQEYGERAGEALDAARALIARDAALGQWLEDTKLGSHPSFVRTAAQKAMALKKAGKL